MIPALPAECSRLIAQVDVEVGRRPVLAGENKRPRRRDAHFVEPAVHMRLVLPKLDFVGGAEQSVSLTFEPSRELVDLRAVVPQAWRYQVYR